MIELLHSDIGEIRAVCEYYIVDKDGNYDAKGKFVWINEVFVAPKFRSNGCLKSLVKNVMEKVPETCEFGYFWRQNKYPSDKFTDRKSIRIYDKRQWSKLLGGNDVSNT